MNKIKKYIEEHKCTYSGHYELHSSVKTQPCEYKFRYINRDTQFREIHIFLTVNFGGDEIEYNFSIDLNDQEKAYILNDALERILIFMDYNTLLHSHVFETYIKNNNPLQILLPQDYRNILDYLEYHKGINQEVVDKFYYFFMPYLTSILEHRSYQKFIMSIELLLDRIVYEYEWDGVTLKYLDSQYQLHMSYLEEIIMLICENHEELLKNARSELISLVEKICSLERFSLQLSMNYTTTIYFKDVILTAIREDLDPTLKEKSRVVRYLYAAMDEDNDAFRKSILDILRFLMDDMLTFTNVDAQRKMGNILIDRHGYDLLIELFKKDYNTFVFACFPISEFPEKYNELIRLELETAILFYAARMENDEYRLSSFEQVFNINRLLLENYKEFYKDGQ